MKRFAFAGLSIMFAMAAAALAADISGTWTGQAEGMGGDPMTLTYVFKQDGAKLTGTVQGPMGDPLEIKEGKVDGDKISFIVSFEGGPNGAMKISNEGTVAGEEIKLTTKFEGGDMPPMTVTLKKSK